MIAEDKTSNDIDFNAMLDHLLSPPSVESFDMDDDNAFAHIVHFIANYVVKLYGLKQLQGKVRDNPGTTFIDFMTVSDLAYCALLVENGNARADQLIEIKTMSEDVQAMYDMKRGDMTKEQKQMYPIVQGKYTNRAGVKHVYLGHGMSADGQAQYEVTKAGWSQLFRDKSWYDMLIEKWYEYIKETGVGKHWRSTEIDYFDADGSAIPEEEEEAAVLCLPGDEDFVDDCPWKRAKVWEDEDEVEDEVEDGDEGSTSRMPRLPPCDTVEGELNEDNVPYHELPKYGRRELDEMCEAAAASNSKNNNKRKKRATKSIKKTKKRMKMVYGDNDSDDDDVSDNSSSDEEERSIGKKGGDRKRVSLD